MASEHAASSSAGGFERTAAAAADALTNLGKIESKNEFNTTQGLDDALNTTTE
jgi:hypothetical protein